MTLHFDPQAHAYSVAGRKLPGVTRVLEPYASLEYADPDVMRVAMEFGSHVHEACYLLNSNQLDRDSLSPAVEAYLAGWERFLAESGFIVTQAEVRVFHKRLHYAGTLDVIGHWPRKTKPAIIDIKTGATMPKTVGPQTAAYNEARGERLPRFCCLLTPGAYNLVPLTDVRDFDIFKAALTLHRWRTGE